MCCRKINSAVSGFTLLEIIVTIVVIGIAATALLSLFSGMVRTSADPMIQQQAVSIAEAYLEEISLMGFADPQGGETGGAEAGETRPVYDDVQDYNSLPDSVVRDQNGIAIGALSAYSITVVVAGNILNGIVAVDSMRIDITVNHAAIGNNVLLSGYRVNY